MSIKLLRLSAIGVFALGVGLLVYGFAFAGGSDNDPAPADVAPTATPSATATRTPTSPPTSTRTPEPTPTETPTPFAGDVARLKIPRFNVDSEIEKKGIKDGTLEVPDNPHNTAWYNIYSKPGWGGNAVFSAHVDYYPNIKGPFYNLAKAELGDEIIVVMENGVEYKYRIISNTRYPVDEIPMGDLIAAVDKPDDAEWITLITCGGRFQSYSGSGGPGYYLDRDVVIAERFE
ncbi:MAG: hypothetical protein Kow0010_03980 [Dehalococcoidia bacterium]